MRTFLSLALSTLTLVVGSVSCGDNSADTDTGASDSTQDGTGTGSSSDTTTSGSDPLGFPDADLEALVGDVRAAGGGNQWRDSRYLPCTDKARIVCVQFQGPGPLGEKDPNRYVFISADEIGGYDIGGYENAMLTCQTYAAYAGLPGYYAPFLGAPDNVPAIWPETIYGVGGGGRVDLDNGGQYVLPGEVGAVLGSNLLDEPLRPVSRFADGTELGAGENSLVWTALDSGLWLDVTNAEVWRLTPDEQDYLALGRTCLSWGSWRD